MSRIEWTDETWNPSLGCSRVSEGCRNSYAEHSSADVARKQRGRTPHGEVVRHVNGEPRFTGLVVPNTDRRFYAMRASRPRTPPCRVFVNSLSDVFHESAIAQGLTAAIFYEMRICRWNSYQVLTKRPDLAAAFYGARRELHHLPHIWLGTSVEDAGVKDRIDILRTIPAAIRFLSIEPLIGPVGEIDLSGIHWVIAGGESGPGHREMRIEWLREVRDKCVAAGVPFFFKQWGGPAGGKRGGAEAVLDGREWKEFPTERHGMTRKGEVQ